MIAGPTASGKSRVAIELALRFGGEIVNADSMQVYQGLDIGTAKPSLAERARVPHHLLDVVPPTSPTTPVATRARRALRPRRSTRAAAACCLTGGTGLYIRAFLEGLIDDGEPDPALRAHLEREAASGVAAGDPARLHRRLAALDADAARRIHPNDHRRTIRALELVTRIGVPASQLRARHDFARPARSGRSTWCSIRGAAHSTRASTRAPLR